MYEHTIISYLANMNESLPIAIALVVPKMTMSLLTVSNFGS